MKGARGLATHVLSLSGLASLSRRLLTVSGRFALAFHGVSKARPEGIPSWLQPHLTVDELRAILGWLESRFSFLTPEEFLTSRKPGVLLTFDDGLANHYFNALSVLAEFEVPAVFFVATQHVIAPRDWLADVREKAASGWGSPDRVPPELAADFFDGMSADQLRRLASHPLATIGSHTVSHPFLTSCSDEQLMSELRESRRFLEETTGEPAELFAYPTGDYDRRVLDAVASSGYRSAFALDSRKLGHFRFEIPRVGIYGASPAYLSAKLSGLHRGALRAAPVED